MTLFNDHNENNTYNANACEAYFSTKKRKDNDDDNIGITKVAINNKKTNNNVVIKAAL